MVPPPTDRPAPASESMAGPDRLGARSRLPHTQKKPGVTHRRTLARQVSNRSCNGVSRDTISIEGEKKKTARSLGIRPPRPCPNSACQIRLPA